SISATLFAKNKKEQVPIYFVSRVLQGAELNYPALKKLILALVHAARRLRRYFQAHTVTVLTNSPIKQALTKPEKSGRVAKWAIELREHDIVFQKRGDDKKETPKDFLTEVPLEDSRKEEEGRIDTKSENTKLSCEWKLYTGGAAISDSLGAGLMLIDPEGKEYTYALRFGFEATNNEAKYEALLAGLRIAQDMEIVSLAIFVDSQLLVNQIKGTYAAKPPTIREYLQKTKEEEESWMTPIHEYLVSGLLLKDPKESRKIRVKAPQYKMIRGSLYRRSFYTSWLRGVASPQTDDIVKEIHEETPQRSLQRIESHTIFSPVTEHMEIMNHIEKKLTRSQQGWVNDLAKVLWVHRTLPRNSQKETPFSLTYGSEAIIPIAKNVVGKDERGRTKEVTKRKESKEVGSIQEARYQNKLRSEVREGELYKIIDASDHSLIQTAKGASLRGDIGLEVGTKDEVAFWEEAIGA
ncbi:reverse transcriptase domain-containing protein, partial [Tanacetum coccineum]